MNGLMMTDIELRLPPLLERAERYFPEREVVTRTNAEIHRSNWGTVARRARRIASALATLGVERSDRVATFAWNTHRQVELYYAVCGAGAVLHTLNVRLFPDQIAWIINHAEDRVIFVDDVLLPVLEGIAARIGRVGMFVSMGGGPISKSQLGPMISYEDLLARGDEGFEFVPGPEHEAALLCYTSGTTGNPKGVLYSHRSLVHASMLMTMVDGFGIGERDSILVAVPLFHAAGWCMPYTGAMAGAKLVLPGPNLAPADILHAIDAEQVTFSAGVPTLWSSVAGLAEQEGRTLAPLRRVICAGSAVPSTLIERMERLGVEMLQAWGMTEAPFVTLGRVKHSGWEATPERRFEVLARQGIPTPTSMIRIVDAEGRPLPEDGETQGELEIRGLNVAVEYYKDERSKDALRADGWFRTGDVATIDREGYMVIRDRTKDVIKSGGEWISSVEIEGLLMTHPNVAEAAVIARPDEKWMERPLACVVPKKDRTVTAAELRGFLAPRLARWWNPETYAFIDEVPKTSIGKFDKKRLRERLANGELELHEVRGSQA
jgi:acyl-CoA synthetase (AMP-forming)/AMP-acid ligase II